jgi:hypothetical protein
LVWLSAQLRAGQLGAQGGDLGHCGSDVGVTRRRDLLVEVRHVCGAALETLDQREGTLCLELLQMTLHLDCEHGAIMRLGGPPLIGGSPLTGTLNRV